MSSLHEHKDFFWLLMGINIKQIFGILMVSVLKKGMMAHPKLFSKKFKKKYSLYPIFYAEFSTKLQKNPIFGILRNITMEGSMETRLHFFIFLFSSNCLWHLFLCLKIVQILFHVVCLVAHCDHIFMENAYPEIPKIHIALSSERSTHVFSTSESFITCGQVTEVGVCSKI